MTSHSRAKLKYVAVMAGCWTFNALITFPQGYFRYAARFEGYRVVDAIFSSATFYVTWMILTTPILRLGRRFTFERPNLIRHFFIYSVCAVAVVMLHNTAAFLLSRLFIPFSPLIAARWPSDPRALLFDNAPSITYLYFALLALSQAAYNARRYRERELRLVEAELDALRMHLQPQFLFTTLDAVAELVDKDPDAAEEAITQLSDLLRSSLDVGKTQEIALAEELTFVGLYLEIQRTLLADRLRVRMEIDPETLDAAVPTMILQPFIENAIRHSFGSRAMGGAIAVRARRVDGTLHLQVHDDGGGVSAGGSAVEGPAFGNTRTRLEYLYPKSHAFSVAEGEAGEVTVDLSIPWREAAREAAQ